MFCNLIHFVVFYNCIIRSNPLKLIGQKSFNQSTCMSCVGTSPVLPILIRNFKNVQVEVKQITIQLPQRSDVVGRIMYYVHTSISFVYRRKYGNLCQLVITNWIQSLLREFQGCNPIIWECNPVHRSPSASSNLVTSLLWIFFYLTQYSWHKKQQLLFNFILSFTIGKKRIAFELNYRFFSYHVRVSVCACVCSTSENPTDRIFHVFFFLDFLPR